MGKLLEIRAFCLGPWQTNCYVVNPAGGAACWIIDASFGPEPMIEAIERGGLRPELLVLTHAHVDHIAGLRQIKAVWPDLPVAIHEAEAAFLEDPVLNLSAFTELEVTAPPADRLLRGGEVLSLGDLDFQVRRTPGHSPGGISLYQADEAVVFAGDTLFNGSIGRYDFPTSDGPRLFESIRTQLLTLPDATRVWPGHGPPTTIGRERATNPFL